MLKGFTIQHGWNATRNGGGVGCGRSCSIVKNHIHHNVSGAGGAGIYSQSVGPALIYDNLIEDNDALTYGGGVGGGIRVVATGVYANIDIQRNVITRNKALDLGGGVHLDVLNTDSGPALPVYGYGLFLDNVVDSNVASYFPEDPYGGGIFVDNYPIIARRNVITHNDPDGATIYAPGPDYPPDFGTSGDPGLNVLMNNVRCDLVAYSSAMPHVPVIGNYWGYLDTPTILDRIDLLGMSLV